MSLQLLSVKWLRVQIRYFIWWKAWGDGLSHGYAGQKSTFFLNSGGFKMTGITFTVEGKTLIQTERLLIAQVTFIT